MSEPFSLQNWNDLIDQVNEVLQNPPENTKCKPMPPLPHVEAPHLWSKADISAVQTALLAICKDNSFGDIPDLWKQSIIDEINSAMQWCNCEPDSTCIPCPWPTLPSLGSLGAPDFRIATTGDSNPAGCQGGYCNYAAKLNGLAVGPANHMGVVAALRGYREENGYGYHFGIPNAFSCDLDGKIVAPSALLTLPPPTSCGVQANTAWVVATHSVSAGSPPVSWEVKISIDIYLQCSSFCTPPGMPIGTPSLLKVGEK